MFGHWFFECCILVVVVIAWIGMTMMEGGDDYYLWNELFLMRIFCKFVEKVD